MGKLMTDEPTTDSGNAFPSSFSLHPLVRFSTAHRLITFPIPLASCRQRRCPAKVWRLAIRIDDYDADSCRLLRRRL